MSNRFCTKCGTPFSGSAFCKECGQPFEAEPVRPTWGGVPPSPPAEDATRLGPPGLGMPQAQPRAASPASSAGTRSNYRVSVMIAAGAALLLLVAGTAFFVLRSTGPGAAAPPITPAVSSTTAAKSSPPEPARETQGPPRSGESPSSQRSTALPPTALQTPPQPETVVVTATVTPIVVTKTVAAPPPASAAVSTVAAALATTTVKTIAPQPLAVDDGCVGTYIVMLGAVLAGGDTAQLAADVQADHPDASMVSADNPCYRFATAGATAMYLGPYDSLQEACGVRFQVAVEGRYVDAYLKMGGLDAPNTSFSCLCPFNAESLPTLAAASADGLNTGPYVSELQGALDRAEVYDRDVNDGDFEDQTVLAVKRFQISRGLTATGVVDTGTWQGLQGLDCAPGDSE